MTEIIEKELVDALLTPPSPTKRKAYAEYKDSNVEWLGRIPAHWQFRRLKFVAKFLGGGTPSKENPEYWKGNIPWVSPKDMKVEKIFDSEEHITEEAVYDSATRLIQPGAVLIVVRSGILRHSIPVAINAVQVAINQDLKAIIPNNSLLSNYFAHLIIGHQEAFLVEWRKSGATVESIELELFINTSCPIPPLLEQHAIASFLDRETAQIDTLIAKKEQLIKLLQEKRAALISQAVTRGLNSDIPMKDSGVEWLGEIPEHWEVRRLKFVISELLKYGANESGEDGDPNLPRYIRITDIDEGGSLRDDTFKSLPSELAKPYMLKYGDILFARSGATVGKSFMYHPSWGEACYAGYLIRARLDLSIAEPSFISYFTASSSYLNWLSSVFIQATIQNISAEKYANLVIALPPLTEQQTIINYLDREAAKLDNLISRIHEGIKKLQEYRTALISAAVTGKIDVRDERATLDAVEDVSD